MIKKVVITLAAAAAIALAVFAAMSRTPQSRFTLDLDEPLTTELAVDVTRRTLTQHDLVPIEPIPVKTEESPYRITGSEPERGEVLWLVDSSTGEDVYVVKVQRVGKLVTCWPRQAEQP